MKLIALWRATVPLAVLLTVLVGCSSDKDNNDTEPRQPATPVSVSWQRSQAAISLDNFSQVHLSGIMRLHQQTVNDIAFSQHGTRMASVGADNNTVVWNLANGESLFVQGDNDGRRVFFGPDDDTVITVNRDGLVRVWRMNMSPPSTLEETIHFDGYEGQEEIVVQSPDRKLLAFGARNGGIRLWQMPEGNMIADFQGYFRSIQALAFSPDSTRLVAVSPDPNLRVWSVPDAELVYELTSDIGTPSQITFSPDSRWMAAASQSGILIWDMETGEMVHSITAGDSAAASALAFSPDGKLLSACGMQPVIGIWDVATGEMLGGLPIPGQTCSGLAFSPDSKLLLTLPIQGQNVYLWDISHIADDVPADQKMLRQRDRENMGLIPGSRFYKIFWSDDGRFIVLVDELGPIYVLSAAQ